MTGAAPPALSPITRRRLNAARPLSNPISTAGDYDCPLATRFRWLCPNLHHRLLALSPNGACTQSTCTKEVISAPREAPGNDIVESSRRPPWWLVPFISPCRIQGHGPKRKPFREAWTGVLGGCRCKESWPASGSSTPPLSIRHGWSAPDVFPREHVCSGGFTDRRPPNW